MLGYLCCNKKKMQGFELLIFIGFVGDPFGGSTYLESILSRNDVLYLNMG